MSTRMSLEQARTLGLNAENDGLYRDLAALTGVCIEGCVGCECHGGDR